jgi:hypothetical protein
MWKNSGATEVFDLGCLLRPLRSFYRRVRVSLGVGDRPLHVTRGRAAVDAARAAQADVLKHE